MREIATTPTGPPSATLDRALGVGGAVMMGLGSIVGTGVFVSLGIAAGIAGPAVIIALVLAAILAGFNGLSLAQLAAAHPVSGGTYEYGYRFLTPRFGFAAGWMFLCAKCASAATAALGFAGYALDLAGIKTVPLVAVAWAAVALIAGVVVAGIRRSHWLNVAIVSVTLVALGAFVGVGTWHLAQIGTPYFAMTWPRDTAQWSHAGTTVLHATALMFVAFTGYGRIATLGEEVREPARTIPRAVVVALVAVLAIYTAVAAVAIGTVGADSFAQWTHTTAAPLPIVAETFAGANAGGVLSGLPMLIAVGAITAMLGVLLNLVLGVSRVILAMGRQADMPRLFAHISPKTKTPTPAVLLASGIIAVLVAIGDVKTTWSFSAFTVLVYYTITNFAALKMPAELRRYPQWIPVCGLVGCLGLAWWVEPTIWLVGIGLLLVGLGWHGGATWFVRRHSRGVRGEN